MRRRYRILIVLICLLAATFCFSLAHATSTDTTSIINKGQCGGNVTWELYADGYLLITGWGAMKNYTQMDQPPYFNPYYPSISTVEIESGVTSVGDYAFINSDDMTRVSIPSTVSYIGEYAFANCSSLASVTIPDNVTSINANSFNNCSSLKSVTIPTGVTDIGIQAFAGCSGLESVTIPDGLTDIASGAFYKCGSLTNVTIPKSVTSIGDQAFAVCGSLTSINVDSDNATYCSVDGVLFSKDAGTIISYPAGKSGSFSFPYGVTYIGKYTFLNCDRLTDVTIPSSVISIGDYSFASCSNLSSVTIPSSVTSIGSHAFANCGSLASITIPSSVNFLGDYAFSKCGLTSVTIPASVTSMKPAVFYECPSLTSVTFGDGMTTVGASAFYGCGRLSDISFPDSVTRIEYSAFQGCGSLTEISLPDGLKYLGDQVFKDCVNLKDIDLPVGMPNLSGLYTFENCTGLTAITIPGNIATIPEGTFKNCTCLSEVVIEDGVKEIVRSAFEGCESLTDITIPGSVKSLENSFLDCASLTNVTLCEGIERINGAFDGCTNLASVTIPNSVKSIDEGAFRGCHALKKVVIPEGITALGVSSFANCIELIDIILPDSLTVIGCYAFAGCSKLQEITIPDNCAIIDDDAFIGCKSLMRIALPKNISSISDTAFPRNKNAIIYCYEYTYADYWHMNYAEYHAIYIDFDGKIDFSTFGRIDFKPPLVEVMETKTTVIVPYLFPRMKNLTLHWASSNPAVATIDESTGFVTALSEGYTDISLDIDGKLGFMMVNVLASDITFNIPQELSLSTGSSQSLPLTDLVPQTAASGLTYSSDDPTVAEIDGSGIISAKTAGETVITVTAENGYNKHCTLHVSDPITGVRFDRASVSALPGVCVQLKALVTSGTTEFVNQFVTFASSNESVAVVEPKTGKATVVGQGTAEISAETQDGLRAVCTLICETYTEPTDQMVLPADTVTVAEEGFRNVDAEEIVLPAGIDTIGALAFADCGNLVYVNIPEGVSSIASDAFDGCRNLTLLCADGSYGEKYAIKNGISYILTSSSEQSDMNITPLERVYNDQPDYDPDTQYVEEYWMNENGMAVRHWAIRDKILPEPDSESGSTSEEN